MELQKILAGHDAEDLKIIVRKLGLTPKPKATADVLYGQIAGTLLKPEFVESRLVLFTDSQISLFERACEGMFIPADEELSDALAVVRSMCGFQYAESPQWDDAELEQLLRQGKRDPRGTADKLIDKVREWMRIHLCVPDEIAAIYRELDTPEFQRRRHVASWLAVCLNVCGKLYAVTPFPVLARVYALKEPVDEAELRAVFASLPHDENDWIYDEANDRILCPPMEEAEARAILERQGDREFHLPKLEIMVPLSEGDYTKAVSAYWHFRRFLREYCGANREQADSLVDELWEILSDDESDLRDDLQWMVDATGADPKVMPLITKLYRNCRADTPCIAYRGCTRGELSLSLDNPEIQDKELELEFDMEIPKIRIGRNEACPCGSGKKYKKCCGR